MPAPVLRLLAAATADTPDAELLGRFAATRDEAAFAELVRRHGPKVYHVCRRLVGPSSADDAFQAVFLVLACRANAVRKAASVGSWLVGVAGRVARQLRAREIRSQRAEGKSQDGSGRVDLLTPDRCTLTSELSAVLADELARLPDALRDPVVLCLVDGRTQEQAAAALGGSVRTLRRRLDRARAVLRARLERRGVVPAVAAGLVAAVGHEAAAVPPGLADRAVTGVFEFLAGGRGAPAAAVAKGVLGTMSTFKASAAVAAVAAAVVGLGIGWAKDPPAGALPPPEVPLSNRLEPPATDPLAPPANNPLVPPPAGPNQPVAAEMHRTPNFVVYAPTPVVARAVAHEAEYQRAVLAKRWLGKELPAWEDPCEVRVTLAAAPGGGASTFAYRPATKDRPGFLQEIRTELRGPFGTVLESHVPHEVLHAVLATAFGRPIPRWADEGIALTAEPAGEQADHDARLRELLNAGRGLRLNALFRLTEYPKDMIVLYAQGHSVVRFLLSQPVRVETNHQQLVMFLHVGADGNTAESWDRAAAGYGFASVDDLERAWLDWLKDPKSQLRPGRAVVPAPAADPERIPPTDVRRGPEL